MRALITGVTGQDGYYLSALLGFKGYEVFGLVRNTNVKVPGINVIYGDITSPPPLPVVDEVYNLAAMSHVAESFRSPEWTMEVNATGAIRMLQYATKVGAKFYQASTSELFGNALPPQRITTPFNPVSPYGVSKLAAHRQVQIARQTGVYACNGILFNHESPMRGTNFVTQKICRGVAQIKRGKAKNITLGNMSAMRDWGHARDYVRGMWQMLQQDSPGDYILATGVSRSVKNFAEAAFSYAGLNWEDHVLYSGEFERPIEVNALCGESNAPFWRPTTSFEELVAEMVDNAMGEYD